MSTKPKRVETPAFKAIDRNIRTLTTDIGQELALLPDTQEGRIVRLVKIYDNIKPLLTVISALPIIPSYWRAALALFNSALAAVAAGAEEVADFKAGRDL